MKKNEERIKRLDAIKLDPCPRCGVRYAVNCQANCKSGAYCIEKREFEKNRNVLKKN